MAPDPAARPVMLFDGDCGFCCRWVDRWKPATAQSIEWEPYQSAGSRFPQIPPDDLGKAIHLVEPDGTIHRGAAAIFRAWSIARFRRYPWLLYQFLPLFAFFSERVYAIIAAHRTAADNIDRLLLGRVTPLGQYQLTRQIFLRSLAVIYAMAFISLWTQIDGLIGSDGILPVSSFLHQYQNFPVLERWLDLPTLCWLNSSDAMLHALCAAGTAAAILAALGIAQLPAFILMWIAYLSLTTAGQIFLGYQWDVLLLETGFLAIFLSPWQCWLPLRPRMLCRCPPPPSNLILWLIRWLLFRVMFMSGIVKLTSGDPTWRNLTALHYHYYTQPLPPWTAWYFEQLPLAFQKLSCGVVFFSELVLPILIFTPRRPRLIAFWGVIFFQSLIIATGNYGFFNLLTIALCFTLPDDAFWRWLLRKKPPVTPPPPSRLRWPLWLITALTAAILIVTLQIFTALFNYPIHWPGPFVQLNDWSDQLHITSGYGLFAIMTTQRTELIVEGSDDGQTWKPYTFKYKPGDVNRRPGFMIPHMPRLDWQMWFAALGGPEDSPWLQPFLDRLLQGSPAVLSLMANNPFPDHPPRYVRVMADDYQFTNSTERSQTGAWWRRQPLGIYYEASANDGN